MCSSHFFIRRATAALAPSDIASPMRSILRRQLNTTVIMGEVTAVDPARRVVVVRETAEFRYDYLILATGAAYSWFGHAEWAAHATVLKSLNDADTIRQRLLSAFEWAESRTDPAEIRRLLTFIVVGGGPTGVELAGSIAELARSTLAREFRRIRPGSARIVLCEAGPRLLAAFPPALSDYALQRTRAASGSRFGSVPPSKTSIHPVWRHPANGSRAPMCSGAPAPRRAPQQPGWASMPRATER